MNNKLCISLRTYLFWPGRGQRILEFHAPDRQIAQALSQFDFMVLLVLQRGHQSVEESAVSRREPMSINRNIKCYK